MLRFQDLSWLSEERMCNCSAPQDSFGGVSVVKDARRYGFVIYSRKAQRSLFAECAELGRQVATHV